MWTLSFAIVVNQKAKKTHWSFLVVDVAQCRFLTETVIGWFNVKKAGFKKAHGLWRGSRSRARQYWSQNQGQGDCDLCHFPFKYYLKKHVWEIFFISTCFKFWKCHFSQRLCQWNSLTDTVLPISDEPKENPKVMLRGGSISQQQMRY